MKTYCKPLSLSLSAPLTLLLFVSPLLAQTPAPPTGLISGYCEQGNQPVVTPGSQNSTTRVQRSFPACTVNVYYTGTTTRIPLFSDRAGTVKSNPFTANATGFYSFYAASGTFDINLSGSGISTPFTLPAIRIPAPVSVRDYGATGNGATDDAPAIRTALASCRDILFPGGGTYLLNSYGSTFSSNSWILAPCSNQTLYSDGRATLKVANGLLNTGGQTFGGGVMLLNSVSNVTIQSLTIDMNGANNLVPVATVRNGLAIKGASAVNINIHDVQVSNSPGHNAFTFDSTSSYISIHSNTITGGGTSLAGNTNQTDWSAIYTEADHSDIWDNSIDNSASGTYPRGAAGGIELHGSFNRAWANAVQYAYPCFYVNPPGSNGTQSHVSITGNECTYGFAGAILGASPNGAINDLGIRSNTFVLTTGSWPAAVQSSAPSYGILQYYSTVTPGTFATINSASITGNIIREDESAPLATPNTIGIAVNTMNGSVIGHNTLQSLSSHGIQVVFTARGLSELLLDGNVIQDFGLNASGFPRAAIIATAAAGSVSGLTITNNVAGLTNASGSSFAFYFDWAAATLNALTIANNVLRNINTLMGGPTAASYTTAISGYHPEQWVAGGVLTAPTYSGLVTAGALTVTGAAGATSLTGNVGVHGGDLTVDQYLHASNVVADTGNITALAGVFVTGSSTGLVSSTLTVRNSLGTGTCTITVKGGIITASTC